MDHAKILQKFVAIQTKADTVNVDVTVSDENITLSNMGPSNESRSFASIQELENFVDGFSLGYRHGRQ